MCVSAIAVGLQAARSQANEQWEGVVAHCDESWARPETRWGSNTLRRLSTLSAGTSIQTTPVRHVWGNGDTHGGNVFQEWRQVAWKNLGVTVVLRQARRFFGARIVAIAYLEGLATNLTADSPELAGARDTLAEVGIELIVPR